MTPTALTPAGRGTRPKPRHGTAKRQPAAPGRATTAAQGARTATQGARTAAQGARTAAQGARTAAEGARTAVKGARTAAHGTRAMAQGARTAAQGARTAAEGARTVARSARTPVASGPAGGRGTGHRAPVKLPTAPRNPRRVSGPARRRPSDQPAVRPPLAARSARFIRTLPDHAVLDRIIRGRYWIPLLGVLLVGIVAMQVEVLKLNAGIGRALEQSTSLQNRNEQLREAVAREADDQRIESIAAHMGMVMPPPAAVRFLQHDPIADAGKAVSSIHAPDAAAFQAALTVGAGATSASAPSTTSGVVSTPSPTSSTSPGA